MIIGLDPGTATVGYSFVSGTRKQPVIHDFGVLTTLPLPPDMMPQRLMEIATDLESLILQHRPDSAIVEELFFFKNHTTVISVAQSRGVILYLLAKHGIPVRGVTPLQVKQTLCGFGRATKKQVQSMVQKIYGLETPPKPDDAADSLAMAWYGLK